jgi:hypothetical protein
LAKPGLARRALAEAFATFALVFAGCGAIIAAAERDQALGTVGIGAVFGLVILAMVYATGHLSGAHINPAVTLAFTATRHFPAREAAAYIPAQLVGAVVRRSGHRQPPTGSGAQYPDGMKTVWQGRVTQATAKYGEHAPMAGVCCNACRACVQTNILAAVLAALIGLGGGMARLAGRLKRPV